MTKLFASSRRSEIPSSCLIWGGNPGASPLWVDRCVPFRLAARSRGAVTCLESAEGARTVLTHSGDTSELIFQGERLVYPYQRVKVAG